MVVVVVVRRDDSFLCSGRRASEDRAGGNASVEPKRISHFCKGNKFKILEKPP